MTLRAPDVINIKTLYGDITNQNCKKVTGLPLSKFQDLQNPLIKSGSSIQFSDLSMKISEYDHEASKSEPEHISQLLSRNIEIIKAEIEKEGVKLLREKTPSSMSESYLKRFQEYVAKLSSLALNPRPEEKDIDAIIMDFKNLEIESKIKMPSAIYSLIGSLYKSAAKRPDKNDD